MNKKMIILFIFCFFLNISNIRALELECPSIASSGEEINIHIKDKELTGIKLKYNINNNFFYKDININNNGKIYYDDSVGFSAGNIYQEGIDATIKFKVGSNIQSNNDYKFELVDIMGSNKDYKSFDIENISCNIKIVNDINTLDKLEVDGVKLLPISPGNNTSYKGTTSNDRINIKATLSDSGATIEGSIGEQYLNIGVNIFNIKVISARGNVREYKLYITRINNNKPSNNKLSSDNSLKSLIINNKKVNLKKDIYLYNIDVDYNIDKVDVKAIPTNDKAIVKIDSSNKLEVGENTINIEVTSEDGTKAIYMVVVNRKNKLSSDNYIKNIKIKNYYLNFKKNTYNYKIDIDEEDTLDIDVILSDSKSKYVIKGNKNLKNGSNILIIVTSEDGKERTYKITINKLKEDGMHNITDNINLMSIIGFILLILVILMIKIIGSRIKKEEK